MPLRCVRVKRIGAVFSGLHWAGDCAACRAALLPGFLNHQPQPDRPDDDPLHQRHNETGHVRRAPEPRIVFEPVEVVAQNPHSPDRTNHRDTEQQLRAGRVFAAPPRQNREEQLRADEEREQHCVRPGVRPIGRDQGLQRRFSDRGRKGERNRFSRVPRHAAPLAFGVPVGAALGAFPQPNHTVSHRAADQNRSVTTQVMTKIVRPAVR